MSDIQHSIAPEFRSQLTRRQLLSHTAGGIGAIALASLMRRPATAARSNDLSIGGLPHFTPRAKRVIFLFQSGGPSQLDLFDYSPRLKDFHGAELPASIRQGQRVTEMTSSQGSFPCAAPMFKFARHGQAGTWLSELLPHTSKIVDDLCVIRSVTTEAINHDPAITFINTGSQQLGKPSMGSWLSYGLGSDSRELPAYVVLISRGSARIGQPLFSRLWSSGFLPSEHQGVQFRSGGDPVLYLSNPPGIDAESRRRMLDSMAQLNSLKSALHGDPEIETRIAQYEMAYRMQTSVPQLMDLGDEPQSVFDLYGPDSKTPGKFAANCLLARRLAERGVRFIQLFHRGWDQHGGLPKGIRAQCNDVDQASAALIRDLKQRGMLDDTLVVWGGEFGRTVYCQGKLTKDNYGRDHHGRCFTMWMAGGGIRGGLQYGRTDDYGYNVVENPVHIRDLNATLLHVLGIDHERFTFRHQGLEHRPTGVETADVVRSILV